MIATDPSPAAKRAAKRICEKLLGHRSKATMDLYIKYDTYVNEIADIIDEEFSRRENDNRSRYKE